MNGMLYIVENRLVHGKPVPRGTVDVSVLAEGDGRAFAPPIALVRSFENCAVMWEDFAQEYCSKVLPSLTKESLSWLFSQALWTRLDNGEYVGELRLGCYCADVRRCHVSNLITWLCKKQPFAGFTVRYLGVALTRLVERISAAAPTGQLRQQTLLGTPYWVLEQNPAKDSVFAWGVKRGIPIYWVMIGNGYQGSVVTKLPGSDRFVYMPSWKLRARLLLLQKEGKS